MLKGTLHDVQIDPDGNCTLARKMEHRADFPEAAAVWSIGVTSANEIIAGTGNEGVIYKIDGKGNVQVLLDSPEIAVMSLFITPDDLIYAGTAPDGLIYRLTPSGKTTTFARTGEHYVWGICRDSAGNILVATGDKARIITYSPDGKKVDDVPVSANHIRCMDYMNKSLWFGTADPALVYRLKDGDLQLVYECREREVSSLKVTENGEVYFSTVAEPTVNRENQSAGPALSPRSPGNQPSESAGVYRISSNGNMEKWWSTNTAPIFAMTLLDQMPVVSCGSNGFLFTVTAGDRAGLMGSLEKYPALCFATHCSELLIGTGNQASVVVLGKDMAQSGTYESEVFDSGNTSLWGNFQGIIRESSAGSVEFSTRSGNRKEPDETWSDWQPVAKSGDSIHVKSPSARFFQWRAVIHAKSKTTSPVLESVRFAYSTPNSAPRITSVTVHPVTKGSIVTRPGGGRVYRQVFSDGARLDYSIPALHTGMPVGKAQWIKLRGLRTVEWKASDPDKDKLVYSISIARFGSEKWTILETDYPNPIYSFDSTAFPDGRYVIRVECSDLPSNPKGSELLASRISRAFIIDNTPPEICRLTAKRLHGTEVVVEGAVADAASWLKKLEYSLDADTWQTMNSTDGILDSESEQFAIHIDVETNRNEIFLRVTDAQENVISGMTEIRNAKNK